MPTYDFSHLSNHDFELLVRDLLQAELGLRLESFKSGRDRGIDLRYAQDQGVIVQCKHYLASGFSKLLHDLTVNEAPKVSSLAPRRYLVATSVSLSAPNKDKIVYALAPHLHDPSDVLGQMDLNNLLGIH